MIAGNPCLACGACCASFRVSFYWSEAYEATAGTVPPEMTRHVAPLLCAMAGTEQLPMRCVALQGTVGIATWCAIYDRRPVVCREFEPIDPDGQANPLCERARQIWGLQPLGLSSANSHKNERRDGIENDSCAPTSFWEAEDRVQLRHRDRARARAVARENGERKRCLE